MTRKCARPYSHWNYWLMQMLGKFGAKRNLYFLPLFKKRSHAAVSRRQQSCHVPRYGPEMKDGRSRVKNGVPKRLRIGESRRRWTIDSGVDDLQPISLQYWPISNRFGIYLPTLIFKSHLIFAENIGRFFGFVYTFWNIFQNWKHTVLGVKYVSNLIQLIFFKLR